MPTRWSDDSAAARADLAACRALLRHGSRSFHAASLLLPARVRLPASALYAFCRTADDAVDLGDAATGLARTRDRLARAYAGAPLPHPVDRAFARTVARHAIPRALPEALIEGLAWDTEGRRYEDLPALRDYAARVAGSVGAMMSLLMGARDADALARACDLGAAMQLTNIARDVGEDAAAGRLYLPLSWLREAGIDPEQWLARPKADAALRGVVARLLAEAEGLYARGLEGVPLLPPGCRPAIAAAGAIYAEIGRAVSRAGHDSVTRRAVVPGRRKLRLAARSLSAVAARPRAGGGAPLPEMRFLVEAGQAAAFAPPPARPGGVAWWDLRARLLWLLGLFERLEERDRQRRDAPRRAWARDLAR
ncbi:phytoene/squalene synthase family protein [Roseomonas nepalensis]|uniref:Phytoene/squalene synthase family protein n=1 Tax=Muricoccus nepalensis TaxID=1854500 RepID=A0A502GCU7_9PROT|nr:phytoene/squalene synthase family protein [Roseomonas nepalensis]TPG58533.1 phytoene/squalene synthase family protein [Roseomonas nepalensis]